MRNNNTSPIVYIGVLLVTLLIMTAANMLRSQFSSEEPQEGGLFRESGRKQYFCKSDRGIPI